MAAALVAWGRERPVLALLVVMALTRALVAMTAAVAGSLGPVPGQEGWTHEGPVLLQYLMRWDSGYYTGIALEGQDPQPKRWAFSIGYPYLINAGMILFPRANVLVVAAVVGHAAAFAVVPLFHALTTKWFGDAMAWRASLLLCLLPSSFWLSAIYPEGLFLALVVGALLAVTNGRWLTAGALASLAGVVRPQGILIPAALALALALAWTRDQRPRWWSFFAVPLALALPALEMMAAHAATGDWLVQTHTREEHWPVEWRWPWAWVYAPMYPVQRLAIFVAAPLLLASLAWAARDASRRRLAAPLEAYALAGIFGLVALCYAELPASTRYILPMLTIPWMLAALSPTRAAFALVGGVALVLQLTLAALFALWFPLY